MGLDMRRYEPNDWGGLMGAEPFWRITHRWPDGREVGMDLPEAQWAQLADDPKRDEMLRAMLGQVASEAGWELTP